MKKFFHTFLSKPVTTAMIYFSVFVVGAVAIFNIPLELTPEVEFPRISVSIGWNGVSPETVESYITAPVESELSSIKGLKEISSRSTSGNSFISLEFFPETDMDFARVEIGEKLSALKNNLPFGIAAPQISGYVPDDLKELQGFLTYSVSANRSQNEIRRIVKEKFIGALSSINGISGVAVFGGNEREISILINRDKAQSVGVNAFEIRSALDYLEKMIPAGKITSNKTNAFISVNNTVTQASDIENVTIKKYSNGAQVRLKDIGRVIDGYREPTDYYRINGKETVTLQLTKEHGANTLKTADLVFGKIENLRKEMPPDFIIRKEMDRSESIREELGELTTGSIYSIIIIVLILIIIFRNIGYSIIITLSIFFSLLFSLILFYFFNIPLNILTISAFVLGFGFMVDNSIVVVDYLDKHKTDRTIFGVAGLLNAIFYPLFAATLTTAAVFIPLMFLTGELRLYFIQFAKGIVFNLAASLFVSFTFIPLVYLKISSSEKKLPSKDETENISFKIYSAMLNFSFRFKKIILTMCILLIGLPVWLLPDEIETPVLKEIYNPVFNSEFYFNIRPYVNYALGGSLNLFFNHLNRGEFWKYGSETYITVYILLPNGNKITRINELAKDIENEILTYKSNIKNVISRVSDEETALIKVQFTPEQAFSSFPYSLKNFLSVYASRVGGANIGVYGFGPGFSSGGGGFSGAFRIIIQGYKYEKLKSIAEQYSNLIKGNPRIDNIDINKSERYWEEETYEVIGRIDREKLKYADYSVGDILGSLASETYGALDYKVIHIGADEINYSVKYDNFKNRQLRDIRTTEFQLNKSAKTKLGYTVDFKKQKVMAAIIRKNQQYVRYVTFDFKGPYQYGKKFVESALERLTVPEGYSAELEKFNFFMNEKDEIEIWKILGIAVILIFMITAGLFESYRKPLLILTAIPFAAIGTIFLFHFCDFTVNRGAYAGLLLLVGLSVNNSILLVDYISRNWKKGDGKELIKLSYSRLRPVFTTTLTTIAALIPLLFGAEDSFWKGLSLSVIGGLGLSSILLIIIIPVFYAKMNLKKNEHH